MQNWFVICTALCILLMVKTCTGVSARKEFPVADGNIITGVLNLNTVANENAWQNPFLRKRFASIHAAAWVNVCADEPSLCGRSKHKYRHRSRVFGRKKTQSFRS